MRRMRIDFISTSPLRALITDGPRSWNPIPLLVLATVLFPMLGPAPAAAQDCISEIIVIYGGNGNIQPSPDFTRVDVDLNLGAEGDYIYVCYKKGVGAPITGLAVTLNNAPPPTDAVYTRIDVDLNRHAEGNFVWLWYTKDPSCTAIHNIGVLVNTWPAPEGYTGILVDLNSGAGGADLFICYEEY